MTRTDALSRSAGAGRVVEIGRVRSARGLWARAILLFGLVGGLALDPAFAVSGSGSCGKATVDGQYANEWNLQDDFYAPMYEAGNPSKSRMSDVYFRYDGVTETAYVLVLARPGFEVQQSSGDAWVKIYDRAQSAIPFTSFQWIVEGGKTVGYEASFPLEPGAYSKVEVHIEILSGRTSSTGKKASPISLTTPQCVAIGNRVWIERNRVAGYQPDVDQPVAGLRIDLMSAAGALVGSRTADADGCFLFDSMPQGGYYLQVVADQMRSGPLAGLSPAAPAGSAADVDDNADQNGYAEGGNVRTRLYNLTANTQPTNEPSQGCGGASTVDDNNANLTADLAFVDNRVALGNRVWIEKNGTPGFQAGDLPAAGVTVELIDLGGNVQGTVATESDGCYVFDNLAPGFYQVRIPARELGAGGHLAGTLPALPNGSNETADDNADHNAASPDFLGNVTTANLFNLQPGIQPLREGQCSVTPTVADASANLTADLAFAPKVAVGNLVWIERNGKPGYQADEDTPATGIPVEVVDHATDKVVATVSTDENGCYLADRLSEGQYVVRIPGTRLAGTVLQGLSPVAAGSGEADDDADQNAGASGADFATGVYNLVAGAQPLGESGSACAGKTSRLPDANVNLTADFAFEGRVAIGNRVWKEMNGQPGYQPNDATSPDLPIDGVTVTVVNQDTEVAYEAITDGNGCYLAQGLPAGAYVAKVLAGQLPLAGLRGVAVDPDTVLAGDDATTDDNADQNGVQFGIGGDTETGLYDLAPGTQPLGESSSDACRLARLPDANVNETADFAFRDPPPVTDVAVGNMVWTDNDGTPGFNPEKDTPKAGVTLELRGENGALVAETQTDAQGCYLFDNLPQGTYYVQVPAANFGVGGALNGYGALPDPDGEGGPASSFGDDPALDEDQDQNGRAEQTPAGLTGNVIGNLLNLAAGKQPVGEAGQRCAGSASKLPDANVNQTMDFAFEAKVAIGNLLWIDRNKVPGFQAAADEPVDGVHVQLYNADTDTAVATATTSGGGFYLFDELSPGRYYLVVPAEEFSDAAPGRLYGYVSFADAAPAAGDDAIDDGADENGLDEAHPELNGVKTAAFVLSPGTEPTLEAGQASLDAGLASRLPDENVDLTADLAFVSKPAPPAELETLSIGSTVWIDVNWNGIHETTEPGVKGVTVTLTGGGLPSPLTAITDDNGNYLFTKLVPASDYKVSIEPEEMAPSKPLGLALASYFATQVTLGLPTSIPSKPLATKLTAGSATDSQVDGDSNGQQPDGYGTRVDSPTVALSAGLEPQDATGETDLGHDQDNATTADDANGDMTIDFGFIHNCAVICDVTGANGKPDGQVTKADTDAILLKSKNATARVVSPAGAPNSGDCAQTGIVVGNDAAWCKAFRRDL